MSIDHITPQRARIIPGATTVGLGDALSDAGYALLVWAVVAGALSFRLEVIVLGQAAAAALLLGALALSWRSFDLRAFPTEALVLLAGLLLAGLGYFLYHFPEGRYTMVSLTSAVLVPLLFARRRLPPVSYPAFVLFLAFVYARILLGAPGIDFVAMHSKNYVFIFLLFLAAAVTFERASVGRPLPVFALLATAFVGFQTASVSSVVCSALLVVIGVVGAPRDRLRWALGACVALVAVAAAAAPEPRAAVRDFHLYGLPVPLHELADYRRLLRAEDKEAAREFASEARQRLNAAPGAIRLGQYGGGGHVENFEATLRAPLLDERRQIWGEYLFALTPKSILLGGFSGEVDVDASLHSSILGTHKKFGALGIVLMGLFTYIVLRRGILALAAGWVLVVFGLRALMDSIAFVGLYFDFLVVGAALSVVLLRTAPRADARLGLEPQRRTAALTPPADRHY